MNCFRTKSLMNARFLTCHNTPPQWNGWSGYWKPHGRFPVGCCDCRPNGDCCRSAADPCFGWDPNGDCCRLADKPNWKIIGIDCVPAPYVLVAGQVTGALVATKPGGGCTFVGCIPGGYTGAGNAGSCCCYCCCCPDHCWAAVIAWGGCPPCGFCQLPWVGWDHCWSWAGWFQSCLSWLDVCWSLHCCWEPEFLYGVLDVHPRELQSCLPWPCLDCSVHCWSPCHCLEDLLFWYSLYSHLPPDCCSPSCTSVFPLSGRTLMFRSRWSGGVLPKILLACGKICLFLGSIFETRFREQTLVLAVLLRPGVSRWRFAYVPPSSPSRICSLLLRFVFFEIHFQERIFAFVVLLRSSVFRWRFACVFAPKILGQKDLFLKFGF